jgi:hypothetical protein
LSSPPNRGYADWQRVENWDGPVLFEDVGRASAGDILSPILDVSRYAYLGGYDSVGNNNALVVFTWYADSAGLKPVGVREFTLSPSIGNPAQYRIPNLGPYVQIRWAEFPAGAFTHTARVFPTNRFHPLEFIPSHPELIHAVNVPFAIGQNINFWASDYYGGPVQLHTWSGQSAMEYAIQYVDVTNVLQYAAVLDPPNANTKTTALVPCGAWKVNVSNTGGLATTVYLTVIASATGST